MLKDDIREYIIKSLPKCKGTKILAIDGKLFGSDYEPTAFGARNVIMENYSEVMENVYDYIFETDDYQFLSDEIKTLNIAVETIGMNLITSSVCYDAIKGVELNDNVIDLLIRCLKADVSEQ